MGGLWIRRDFEGFMGIFGGFHGLLGFLRDFRWVLDNF